MSSGQVQETFSSAVAFGTSGSMVPFTGLPGAIAHGLFITASTAGLQVMTVSGQVLNFSNSATLGMTVPVRCVSYQMSSGSFVAMQ